MSALHAMLEPRGEARVALQSVEVQARLLGLLSEVTLTQTYRNLEQTPIEAVYTFPLPLDGVLLELTLELNGQTLTGVVQPRPSAAARYERAVDEGDSAVLLEQLQPGLFSLNLANLLPGESARIRIRYAQLHRWQGTRLRFHLPTTLAPRYGDPLAAGLAPHQVPETVLDAEHGFSLTLRIEGALARAEFECPSHPVAVEDEPGARTLRLAGGSRLMDRDFILVLREPDASPGQGLWARDREGGVALAAFHPRFPASEGDTAAPRCIKLVVDGSGSMAGDAIAQARLALGEILQQLRVQDRFNLIAFGSSAQSLWPATVPADAGHLQVARHFLQGLEANLGGTEIGAALELAYRTGSPPGVAPELLLITDGEVWQQGPVIETAARSGHRIFSVGVGSAVSEAFVRQLAERTGGACELVSPREDMAERIVRHFQRIHQPKARSVQIVWPGKPIREIPEHFAALYAGDTLHLFAWLPEIPQGEVRLEVTTEDGQTLHQSLPLAPFTEREEASDTLPRLAAQARLQTLTPEEARELAVAYQLISPHTSCVLVHEREVGEKADGVPALRKVPQVLAAGWGGAGSVEAQWVAEPICLRSGPQEAGLDYKSLMQRPAIFRSVQLKSRNSEAPESAGQDYLDIPAFLRRTGDEGPPPPSCRPLAAALNARYPGFFGGVLDIDSLAELKALGLDPKLIDELSAWVDKKTPEALLVLALLQALLERDTGKGFSRHVQRLIRRAAKETPIPEPLRVEVGLLARRWGL